MPDILTWYASNGSCRYVVLMVMSHQRMQRLKPLLDKIPLGDRFDSVRRFESGHEERNRLFENRYIEGGRRLNQAIIERC